MFKRLAVFVMLVMVAFLHGSCSNSPSRQETVFLTFWTTTTGAETKLFQRRIEGFHAKYPNIKVVMYQRAFPAATNEFKTAILGDQSVDVFRADNTWIPEYADLDIIYPLNTFAAAGEFSGFMRVALSSVEYQGRIYGFPSVIEVPALLYNERLLQEAGFDKPPKTMDELLTVAKAVTGPDRYGIYLSEDSYFALPYLWAFGGDMVTNDRRILIAAENSRKALEFMMKLRHAGVTQPYKDFNNGYNIMMDDFKKGNVAMIINGPWAVQDILKGREFIKDSGNLGITPIPRGTKYQRSPVGGHSLVINRYTNHPEESYALIRYLTSTETQIQQSREFRTLPTQKAAYQDIELAADPFIQGFKSQLDAAKTQPRIPEGAKLFMDFTSNLNAMLLDKQSVEDTVLQIEASWKSLLKIWYQPTHP